MINELEFTYLCGTANSGDCLVSAIQSRIGKPSLCCDQETTNFLPWDPRAGEKLILIDAVFQTGGVFTKCKEAARKCGAEVVKVVSVIDNNMLDSQRRQRRESNKIDDQIQSGDILCLYKMSDLYTTWWLGKKEIEKEGQREGQEGVIKSADSLSFK